MKNDHLNKNLLYKGFKPIMNSKGEEKTENLGQQWSEKSIFFFLKVSADLLLYLRIVQLPHQIEQRGFVVSS